MIKFFFFFTILSLTFSCNKKQDSHHISLNNIYNYVEQKADSFEHELHNRVIDADYIINVTGDTVQFEGFIIKSLLKNNKLSILINKDTIKPYKYETLNDVWGGKDSVNYSNTIGQIKYYKDYNLLMFQLYFYPCTGLGCGVNYQLIYNLETKNIFAFGRFRTGYDMELYGFNRGYPFYLSKSFNGRNIEERDTITYELFKLEKDRVSNFVDAGVKNKAVFIYQNDTLENFKVDWLKD